MEFVMCLTKFITYCLLRTGRTGEDLRTWQGGVVVPMKLESRAPIISTVTLDPDRPEKTDPQEVNLPELNKSLGLG